MPQQPSPSNTCQLPPIHSGEKGRSGFASVLEARTAAVHGAAMEAGVSGARALASNLLLDTYSSPDFSASSGPERSPWSDDRLSGGSRGVNVVGEAQPRLLMGRSPISSPTTSPNSSLTGQQPALGAAAPRPPRFSFMRCALARWGLGVGDRYAGSPPSSAPVLLMSGDGSSRQAVEARSATAQPLRLPASQSQSPGAGCPSWPTSPRARNEVIAGSGSNSMRLRAGALGPVPHPSHPANAGDTASSVVAHSNGRLLLAPSPPAHLPSHPGSSGDAHHHRINSPRSNPVHPGRVLSPTDSAGARTRHPPRRALSDSLEQGPRDQGGAAGCDGVELLVSGEAGATWQVGELDEEELTRRLLSPRPPQQAGQPRNAAAARALAAAGAAAAARAAHLVPSPPGSGGDGPLGPGRGSGSSGSVAAAPVHTNTREVAAALAALRGGAPPHPHSAGQQR